MIQRFFKGLKFLSITVFVVSAGLAACKSVEEPQVDSSTAALSAVTDPSGRASFHKGSPWVAWQWYPGNRLGDDLPKASRVAGVAKGVLDLDETRAKMVSRNLVDTEGYYGAGPQKIGDKQTWKGLDAGRVCDDAGNCEDVVGCGPKRMDNPRYRARTLNGTCNDFDNALMGSVGIRMARNVSVRAANEAMDDFDRTQGGKPDPVEVAETFMVRKDASMHAPAPHFNLWAAAWIQFMTHDWFSHSKDGFNASDKSYAMSKGPAIPATPASERMRGTQRQRCRLLEREGKSCQVPKRTFHNNQTHWWDGSQIYGWDKASEARAREVDASGRYTAKLKMDGSLLPEMRIAKYGGLKQEAAAFIDNWWVGLSLLHTMFTANHNYLVDELRVNATPTDGSGQWTEQTLYDTARLINAALMAKIHTTEWTPQLLFNRLGGLALQANWHGIANYQVGEIQNFRQEVAQNGISKLLGSAIGKIQDGRCLLSASLLGSFSGITNLKKAEHFCSPFTLPEEFTTVYRLHAMMPDFIDLFSKDGSPLSESEVADLGFRNVGGRIPTVETLREKSAGLMRDRQCRGGRSCSFGKADWAMTFGKHPCGQLTAGNFPKFLSEIETPAPPRGRFNLAAVDLLRDRERGVPRFNEFRQQLGLTPLKSVDDFVDRELEWEIENQATRQFGGKPRPLSTDPGRLAEMVATRQKVLDSQKSAVTNLRRLYGRSPACQGISDSAAKEKCIVDQVDVQVGIQAEFVRPHGYVISETQFQVFVMNASRRIFSDRFFTKAGYNEQFYTKWGLDFVKKTYFIDLVRMHLGLNMSRFAGGLPINGFDLWDRKIDGFSLCPDGSAWFEKYPGVKKTYRDLFCLKG